MNYRYDITSGLLASFIGIYGLNILYEFKPYLRQDLGSYRKRILFLPLYYIGITILISKFLDGLFDKDAKIRTYFPYLVGLLVGFILSILGRFYWNLDEILGIENPLMLHVYIPIFYMIIYGLVIKYMIQC